MNHRSTAAKFLLAGAAAFFLSAFDKDSEKADKLSQARNLGKAFYENPTSQAEAVEQFKKAFDLNPDSARERINYGIALLRAAKTAEGIAELEKGQKQDATNRYTWFNLGIAYKKESRYEDAIKQFEQMIKLEPDEPISHYNLGYLYRLTSRPDDAIKEFEISSKLNPNLAGPHYALYNLWRQSRPEDAAKENQAFLAIRNRNKGAAVSEDLEWCYFAEIFDPADAPPTISETSLAPLDLKSAKFASGVTAPLGMATADLDGDGTTDLIVWSADTVKGFQSGSKPIDLGIANLKDIINIVPGDFNNDGAVDLVILTKSGASLWVSAKGKYTRSPIALPAGEFTSALWVDFDHDYDIDLFLLGEHSALARNNGAAGFSDETKSFPFVAGKAAAGVMFDLIPDADPMDIAVAYADRPGVLYRDRLNGKYEAVDFPELPAGTKTLLAADMDNDRSTDLIVSDGTKAFIVWNKNSGLVHLGYGKSNNFPGATLAIADLDSRGWFDLIVGSTVQRNLGAGKFLNAAAKLPVSPALTTANFTGTLTTVASFEGPDIAFLNTAKSNALRIAIAGVKNVKLSYGGKVEVKAGNHYQKQTYRGNPLLFGLPNGLASADTVRITWPNGLIQNELKQTVAAHVYKEAQRLSGSCPMIFTWTGRGFTFLTDVLGVAPLGASSGDGNYFPLDHDEYIQIPGERMVQKDGQYEIRISEELREVSYIDQIHLISVDHPADTAIYTNDKFKSPPFPEFRLFGVKQPVHPTAARDDKGRDVLSKLLHKDQQYPDAFERDFAGSAKLHNLDLDFARAAPSNKAVLILSGWVDWADGSTFLQASQESKEGLIFPYLQVKDAHGEWKTVIEDMGIPAGKPKTISVDLTGKFLSASREVRIVTNLCVYWDEIFLSEDTATPQTVMTKVDARYADLHFRGFSKAIIDAERKQPESFLYHDVSPTTQWNPTPGFYTRYGDVRELLSAADDKPVLMGSGDELTLHFNPASFPALKPGWKRDFLLFVDGWAKDADANTAYSTSVEPLPFHAMSAYPFPAKEHFPDDATHRQYQQKFNTRPALRLLRPLIGNAPNTKETH